ncbi:CPBP family intramembrane glutamic endopeptidase [Ectopseudomonas mendocina]|uniref:CPBP family intramembrane metalloprotease n=1 Tax=Ectopseudomonas mendocina TaxID=300 RepID=A0A2R3QU28_ECTME|nr:CPBP family intramembrane glutamic endopeptidase [Pseudomonas mendocina]AVO55301.1 CPBP family intramembrane metalloprotease [Pseudomonas mendocina]
MPLHLRLLLPAFTLALGHALGFIQPIGLLLGTGACVLILFGEQRLPTWLWQALVLVAGVTLVAHLLPGFSPWTLWQPRQISPDAPPYALRLSWDKLLLGTALLAWWLGQPSRPVISPARALWVCLLTLLAVPVLAIAVGLVAWQPKWPEGLLLWLLVNLGVAVLAEELLFRGVLQPALVQRLGSWPGLLLTAAIFGAVHLPFSPLFAMLATLAGLGYGLVFHYSGCLSLAVALHGAVNLLHLSLLSYPLRLA